MIAKNFPWCAGILEDDGPLGLLAAAWVLVLAEVGIIGYLFVSIVRWVS